MKGRSVRGVRIIGSLRYMIASSGGHRRTCLLLGWLKCNVFQPAIAMACGIIGNFAPAMRSCTADLAFSGLPARDADTRAPVMTDKDKATLAILGGALAPYRSPHGQAGGTAHRTAQRLQFGHFAAFHRY
jgi:hypothetical protein